MMMRRKKVLALFLLGIFFFTLFFLRDGFAQQIEQEAQIKSTQVEKSPEKIIPSPKDIKEKTGILVFVAWMWVAICVLLFILRQKIKEADRLYELRFFNSQDTF